MRKPRFTTSEEPLHDGDEVGIVCLCIGCLQLWSSLEWDGMHGVLTLWYVCVLAIN